MHGGWLCKPRERTRQFLYFAINLFRVAPVHVAVQYTISNPSYYFMLKIALRLISRKFVINVGAGWYLRKLALESTVRI